MKMYSSLVFLSPGNPWWVVESHTECSSKDNEASEEKRNELGPVCQVSKRSLGRACGNIGDFAMTLRTSWKYKLEWQEKSKTWHTRTWCGAEQGTRSLVSRWGWRRSLARWEPKGRAAVLGKQGLKCQVPAVGDTSVGCSLSPPSFYFYLFLPFSKQFPKNQWKKHIIQSYSSQAW